VNHRETVKIADSPGIFNPSAVEYLKVRWLPSRAVSFSGISRLLKVKLGTSQPVLSAVWQLWLYS